MKILLFTLISVLALNSYAQNVNIPDANFKAYLVGNTLINTNFDTEIQVSEATAFGGAIDCTGQNITNLTGIEAFTALTYLVCYNNQLTSLDVSQNTALVYLYCAANELTCLNVKNGNNANFNYFTALANPNLTCIEVDDVTWSNANWFNIDAQTSFSTSCANSCAIGINELSNTPKQLLKIVDLMGRETLYKPNTVLIYVFDDGSTKKVFKMEE